MNVILERLFNRRHYDPVRPMGMLGGFMESLLQMFENCRTGLSDEILQGDAKAVRNFFLDLYQKEASHLQDVIEIQEMHRSDALRRDYFEKVDAHIRKIVIPSYARLAGPFTRRERNDFYWLSAPLHGLERLGWSAIGLGLGAFVVWAPFIPLWSKEWCLAFALGGLVFPDVRRFLAVQRYGAELARLVACADDEIRRIEQASYLRST